MAHGTLSPFCTEVLNVDSTARSLSSDKYLLGDQIIDGGFEVWTDANNPRYWTASVTATSTVDREGTTFYAGVYALKLTIDASNHNASVVQTISLIPGYYYKLDLQYQNSTSGKTSKVTIADTGANVYLQSDGTWAATSQYVTLANSNAAWTNFTLDFRAHGSYSKYTVTIANLSAATSNIFVDSFKIYEISTGRAVFPEPALEAFGVLETANIRFAKGGLTPTTVVGQVLESGQNYTFQQFDDMRTFMAIRTTATSGILTIEYRR